MKIPSQDQTPYFTPHTMEETLLELFFEIHKDIPREGPGFNASTKQALTMLGDLPINLFLMF